MSVTAACHNGRPRKQLSDQLDRLDGIIDVLADALPEAIRDGLRDALQAVVADALADPATLAVVRRAVVTPPPAAAAGPSRRAAFLARCQEAAAAVRAGATRLAARALSVVRGGVRRAEALVAAAASKVASVRRACHVAWHLKRAAVIAVAVGAAVAVVSLASHPVATALSGVGAGLTAFAVQAGLWCRRAVRPWVA
ncbi:hypothetical protein [Limnoglobus roseus]|uniref:Uncharacterized protein n=1 Tax=Limnoglobus roseus TaxID=2598579 RepID=A0A5C1AKT4_9BACT|nr:hypothetical protein [Limnoglobus roseus]QEL17774.1 hypothetical protein PX52LOC_04780 [Limnoglobus roseus]